MYVVLVPAVPLFVVTQFLALKTVVAVLSRDVYHTLQQFSATNRRVRRNLAVLDRYQSDSHSNHAGHGALFSACNM